MKQGIYINCGSKTVFSGVNKKIVNQIKVLSTKYNMEHVIIEKERTCLIKSIMWRLPFGSMGRTYGKALCEIEACFAQDPDFLYIRGQSFDIRYLNFLKTLRKRYDRAKIILEIPTYPYSKELIQDSEMWPFYFKDIVWRNRAKKYIDKIVTFSNDEYIFGIPTIITKNGINVDDIEVPKYEAISDGAIHLLAVAQFQKSHGYERIISSLHEYVNVHNAPKIILDFVGEGKELLKYKKMVKKLKIEDYVNFWGYRTGEELEQVYNNADLCLGFLGLYKRGIRSISSLKVCEYLAHGLPVVDAGFDRAFSESANCDFYLGLPNDSSKIDMNRIIEFYILLKKKYEKADLRREIRKYAFENVDMRVVMRPILDYIEDIN